ncbi:hypothetical protein NKH77_39055 [Streptomyces sp. M19]
MRLRRRWFVERGQEGRYGDRQGHGGTSRSAHGRAHRGPYDDPTDDPTGSGGFALDDAKMGDCGWGRTASRTPR